MVKDKSLNRHNNLKVSGKGLENTFLERVFKE